MTAMKKDMRVEIAPDLDIWMQGDRYGVVVKVGRRYIDVKMDKSGKTLRFLTGDLTPIS